MATALFDLTGRSALVTGACITGQVRPGDGGMVM